MRYFSIFFILIGRSAWASDLPVHVPCLDHPIGYCVPIGDGAAVSAAHVFTIPRKLSPQIEFLADNLPVKSIQVADGDICILQSEVLGSVNLAEATCSQVCLKQKLLDVQGVTDTEIYLDWEKWIEGGLSGSGLYNEDGELIGVLTRIKRGEYAVGTLVWPYFDK